MKTGTMVNRYLSLILVSLLIFLSHTPANGCTGITLKAQNGAIVYGRTLEWGTFDLLSRILIIPRGHNFVGHTPDGTNGIAWTGKYGIVGIDGLEKPVYLDAMNEKGLVAGLFYHPGFAEYLDYDPSMADSSMGPTDVMQFILSNYASVQEVKDNIDKIRVVKVVEEALGFPAPIHLIVSDPTGEQIVIEWDKGQLKIFEAPLGVITNSPTYDWHMTNLRNYVNLSPVAIPAKKIEELDFSPLGGGSGMIGLPGDFTPPSRFIRAVAFTQTSRPTADGPETIYEIFRILDNFNVPLGAAEGSGEEETKGMRSATIWTSAHDLSNKVMYYHTQHNRQVRMIDVSKINFDSLDEIMILPLDQQKSQPIEDRTP